MHGESGLRDTDTNKTEVDEIEMVDMEGRDLENARHRMETRGRVVS